LIFEQSSPKFQFNFSNQGNVNANFYTAAEPLGLQNLISQPFSQQKLQQPQPSNDKDLLQNKFKIDE